MRTREVVFGVVLSLALAVGCEAPAPDVSGRTTMKISSPAFNEGGPIPKKYTCDGENISPPLVFEQVPAGTQTLALIADDPDAPSGTWVHWVVFNLPAMAQGLQEGVSPAQAVLENGARQGTNSFRKMGYGGPCPPGSSHRYYFKLYALNAPLLFPSTATAKDIQAAMQGHVQAEAQLMGRYQRQK